MGKSLGAMLAGLAVLAVALVALLKLFPRTVGSPAAQVSGGGQPQPTGPGPKYTDSKAQEISAWGDLLGNAGPLIGQIGTAFKS